MPCGICAGVSQRETHRPGDPREPARALDRRLEIAQDPLNLGRHARSLMLERDRGLIERVHEYRQRQREIERERSRTLERGRDRDLDLSR